MQFGYALSDDRSSQASRAADELIMDMVYEAVYAEQLGYRSAWLGEHRADSFVFLSGTELALTYIAARTKKIRLVPAVTLSPSHHPIRIAEQWATLDLLSRGRVDCAVGDGAAGADVEVFAEGLACLGQLWAGTGPATHRGGHYRLEDIAIAPQPVQRPIPISVAAASPAMIDLAARRGFGLVLASSAAERGGIGAAARAYHEACAEAGRKPGRLTARCSINTGSPGECADALKAMEADGFDEIVLDFHVGFTSRELVRDAMASFMADIAPSFAA